MRVEEMEQWVMDLGENPQDATLMQYLMKTKDTNSGIEENDQHPGD
jgi:hypothetical protein